MADDGELSIGRWNYDLAFCSGEVLLEIERWQTFNLKSHVQALQVTMCPITKWCITSLFTVT